MREGAHSFWGPADPCGCEKMLILPSQPGMTSKSPQQGILQRHLALTRVQANYTYSYFCILAAVVLGAITFFVTLVTA